MKKKLYIFYAEDDHQESGDPQIMLIWADSREFAYTLWFNRVLELWKKDDPLAFAGPNPRISMENVIEHCNTILEKVIEINQYQEILHLPTLVEGRLVGFQSSLYPHSYGRERE